MVTGTPTTAGTNSTILTASNAYGVATQTNSFVIAKGDQTISISSLGTKYLDEGSFTLNGTASSGLTVSYTSSNTNVATVSGSTVTLKSVGTTTITSSQSGNSNWNAAMNAIQTLTVQARDTDGDGVTDVIEIADGTNPNDASSYNSLNKGLVAYYPFNGNAKDESGNGRNANVTGPILTTDARVATNTAYSFDGIADIMTCSEFSGIEDSQLSVSLWIQADTTRPFGRNRTDLIGKDGVQRQWVLQLEGSGQIRNAILTGSEERTYDS